MEKNNIQKTNTFIFIFIPKILSSHMQNLVFFLKKNDFSMARSTKKNKEKLFVSFFKNSNYVLENQGSLEKNQLKSIIDFLNQSVVINGVFFQNQILNMDRVTKLQKPSLFRSWNKKFTIIL